jgi:O-antigen/teichoic acid export membrane protein
MLLKHTVVYSITKLLPAIATLIGISLFTRLLSPNEYGLYSLSLLIASAGSAIFFQWLSLSLGRFYQEGGRELKDKLLSTILISFILVSLFVIVVSFIAALLLDNEVDFLLVTVLAITTAWFELNQRLSNADLKPKPYAISLTVKSFLAVVGGYYFILIGFSGEGVLIALCISYILATCVQLNYWKVFKLSLVDKKTLIKMLDYGLPLTLTFLMLFIINGSGKFFLNYILDKSAVGMFSVAYDFTQYIIVTLCGVLHLAAFPLIIKAYSEKGELEGKKQLLLSLGLLVAVSIPLVFGLISTVNELVTIFLGEEFRESAIELIPPIAIALLLMVLKSYYFDYAFQLAKNTKLQLVGVAGGAIASFIANPILINLYGVEGATYAMLISFFVYLIICIYLGRRIFDMPTIPWLNILKVCLSCGLMILAIEHLTITDLYLSLLVKVTLGCCIYSLSMLLLNYMGIKELFLNFLKERQA